VLRVLDGKGLIQDERRFFKALDLKKTDVKLSFCRFAPTTILNRTILASL